MTSPLAEILAQEIQAHGPITFRRFMEQALYHPLHGYYAAGKAVIGREGDYFTSVSVGPLFGRLLARQFREMWEHLGRPGEFTVIEQGAHSGTFARDVLEAAGPDFREALRYMIVEPFSALRNRQQETLCPFPEVEWSESLEDLPPRPGVHFSNELIDAMPVHLVIFRDGEWRERCVNEEFAFVDGPLSTEALRLHLERISPPAVDGYQTEVNLDALHWLEQVARAIPAGFLLAIDYGFERTRYFSPERTGGTLSAYSKHRRVPNPLLEPGAVDLTAHVDFTSLSEKAQSLGWRLDGFTDQHHFCVALGEQHFAERPPDPKSLRAFQTLMHPTMLGTAFQVLGLSRGLADAFQPTGFRYGRNPERALGLCPG